MAQISDRVAKQAIRGLARSGLVRTSQRPLLGRPAEGRIPVQAALNRARRAARVEGLSGLPNPFDPGTSADAGRASRVFRNQLKRAGIDITAPGPAITGRGNFRGGSSSAGPAPAQTRASAARAIAGLSPADRAVVSAFPSVPGLAAGAFSLASRVFGPFPGVLGPIAPRIGTQAFRDTITASRNPALGVQVGRSLGMLGIGGLFGGRGGGGGRGRPGRGGGTQGGAGQGPNAR